MSEYEERLWNYQTAMAMARQMLSQGIITGKEYAKIDATIAKKYGVSSCSIFRFESPKSLDNRPFER